MPGQWSHGKDPTQEFTGSKRTRGPAGRAGNGRASAGDPTDEILRSAAALFGELGVAGTTMSRLAAEVGLGQSSLYYYFRSREEIVAALVARANVTSLDLVTRIAAEPGSAAERLGHFVRGDVEALCALPFDINEVHRIAARDRRGFAVYWRERSRLERRLAGIIRAGVTSGELRPVEPRLTALTIMANDEGVQNWFRLGTRRTPAEVGRALAAMTVRGLVVDRVRRGVTLLDGVVLVLDGLAAGIANTVAGGGSLLVFPVLVAVGYPAVAANVTTTLALWPGYLSGAAAYRAELADQRERVRAFAPFAVAGAITGTVLLLRAPPGVFKAIVPYLVLFAVGLLALQPRIAGRVQRRRAAAPQARPEHRTTSVRVIVFVAAVYGGYFGGGLGVIMVAVFGILLVASAQEVNGLKNAMSVIINTAALVGFAAFGPVAWEAVAVVGPASLIGGVVGGRAAKRLSATGLRGAVIIFGVVAGIRLLLG